MQLAPLKTLYRVLTCLTALLVLKVTGGVVLNYRHYFPPSFESGFLLGRDAYFFGSYRWAFYTHLVAGPVALVLGLILVSEKFRRRFPNWHRAFGRVQVVNVLFLVAPSGLWMACRAEGGAVAGLGFAALAIVTAASIALGWRAAVKRRFGEHRRWMWRCFLLLCSTVVLRLVAGLAAVTGVEGDWVGLAAAWASWLAPLAAFELAGAAHRRWSALLAQPEHTARPGLRSGTTPCRPQSESQATLAAS